MIIAEVDKRREPEKTDFYKIIYTIFYRVTHGLCR